MNPHIQHIIDSLQQNSHLTEEEKSNIIASLKDANKELEITAFKLDRTEKVKRTTAILLEETIEELENKRKAVEAQNKVLEIEAALERVRSRSLAMHKSDEIGKVVWIIVEKMKELGITAQGISVATFIPNTRNLLHWHANTEVPGEATTMRMPYFDDLIFNDCINAIESGAELLVKQYSKEEKDNYTHAAIEHTDFKYFSEALKQWIFEQPSLNFSFAIQKHSGIFIEDYNGIAFSKEVNDILIRFSKVFEQAYIRFLDLQKAETQAREAQIEAALEKIRSKSLAMHHSVELKEVIKVVFERMKTLDVLQGTVAIWLFDEKNKDSTFWLGSEIQSGPTQVNIPFSEQLVNTDGLYKDAFQARISGKSFYNKEYSFDMKNTYFDYVFAHNNLETIPESVRTFIKNAPSLILNLFVEKNSILYADSWKGEIYPEEKINILRRVVKVFEQAYIRFLDLQKAEAQAREAQIEAALERVRSRSLAMHKSEELQDVIMVVSDQLQHLGFRFHNASFVRYNEKNGLNFWLASPGQPQPYLIQVPYLDNAVFNRPLEAIAKGIDFIADVLTPEENHSWIKHLIENSLLKKNLTEENKKYLLETRGYARSLVITKNIILVIGNYASMPYSDEQNAILKKVGNVFEQAHTRFLDLQKAEAQARESQIQLALERVRARTMAMQKSGELVNIVKVVFQQFQQLGFEMEGGAVHIGIFNDTSKVHTQWSADPLVNTVAAFDIPYNDNPVFLDLINARARGENFFYQRYSFEEKNKWFDWAFTHTDFKRLPDEFKMILKSCESYAHWTAFQKNAAITINNILGKTLSSDQINILKRFAEVFEQAYTRFLDLQRAEAASKEAIRQAALDRIRADIASMRTVKDLDRITPIIWNELTILGIPFIRCGVFIMNDEQQQIHTFLSTPDGKAIAAFHIPYSTPGNIKQVVNHWHENKNYIDHWDEDAFTTFAEILVAQGALASPEQYLQTIPHSGFYLHFLPFLQGMLYAGNTNQLSEDEINIIQSVANAFSTAYSRYEDFNKLEAAKKQVDSTLNELKSTQSQLIQSEKMASLGELTAGIAHEIQNPLNFVNNFSEVNIELINDMNDENNIDEIKSIANDIKQNSEKILFHGKRADAIVKGMLQHSRTSSGQKEPTDMNALCDEYLRLSYHGLRAKDKNFNAKFETDFDNTIQKINIVPQEIGRVILNLINNAFYAVNEKKKATKAGYEPTVSVSTKKEGNKILISVADNGNGIPEKIKDKIFQPFFTTKPTGQGTGLGLSLSYDIIKAHGGEIKVNTKENEGSEFIIELTLK